MDRKKFISGLVALGAMPAATGSLLSALPARAADKSDEPKDLRYTANEITDAGAKRAETWLFNIRLMAIEPIAMPIDRIPVNSVATRASAPNTFFTSGGKM